MGQSRCLAMVSWDGVCRPIKRRGLRILHIQSMNTVLLMKWVTRIMGPPELSVLKLGPQGVPLRLGVALPKRSHIRALQKPEHI